MNPTPVIQTLADLVRVNSVNSFYEGGPGEREVANYVVALEHGIARLPALGLSVPLLKEVHALLMREVRDGRAQPGKIRTTQNWIGLPGSTPHTAVYVPPRRRASLHFCATWKDSCRIALSLHSFRPRLRTSSLRRFTHSSMETAASAGCSSASSSWTAGFFHLHSST